MRTSIHDALGMSIEDLEANPNFPPALIVEDGRMTQSNFHSPFTGDTAADGALWAYLLEVEAPYANEEGVPRFSAAIVPDFVVDAGDSPSSRTAETQRPMSGSSWVTRLRMV